jgi:spore coat protein U-like protein
MLESNLFSLQSFVISHPYAYIASVIDVNFSANTSSIWRFNYMLRRFAFASILLIASSAAPAMAGSASADLTTSASVTANCTISTSALAFGAYDPVSANASSALDGTGSVSTICTNGSSAAIRLGQGSNADASSTDDTPVRRLKHATTNDYLSYALYQEAARTTVWGNTTATDVGITGSGIEQTNTIYGRIPAGQNVPAGNYSDTVTATVDF